MTTAAAVAGLTAAVLLAGCGVLGSQGSPESQGRASSQGQGTGAPGTPSASSASSLPGSTGTPSATTSPGATDGPAASVPSGSLSGSAPGPVVTDPVPPMTSPRPSPSPSRPSGPPAPVRVRGYTLAAAPPDVLRTFTRLARTFDGVFDGVTVRRVRRGGDEVATIVLMRVDEKFEGNRAVEQRILPGLVTGLGEGGKVTRTRVGRQQIAIAEPEGATLVAWYRKGLVVLVLGGDDRAPVVTYSRGYVAAT